jgi:uncharacterized Ntn-hydrolase superfamily protein
VVRKLRAPAVIGGDEQRGTPAVALELLQRCGDVTDYVIGIRQRLQITPIVVLMRVFVGLSETQEQEVRTAAAQVM